MHTQCVVEHVYKLSKEEEGSFNTIFDHSTLLSRPEHVSGCELCHMFALKCYCFSDCNNKASHNEWSILNKSSFDDFQKKARGI